MENKFKYNEDVLVDQLKQYIESTYKQHYNSNIKDNNTPQLLDLILEDKNALGFLKSSILKYTTRYEKKDGANRKDILKILHYAILMLYYHDCYKKFLPYTYLIGWTNHNKWYYGCQYGKREVANPNNLWKTYFTSSNIVRDFREQYGEPDVIQVRRIFKTKEAALKCEERVLKKVNAVKSDQWLNASIFNTKEFERKNFKHTEKTKQIISNKNKGAKRLTDEGRRRLKESLKINKKSNTNVRDKLWYSDNKQEKRFIVDTHPVGFVLGRLRKKQPKEKYSNLGGKDCYWIHKGTEIKRIRKNLLSEWESRGWKKGNPKISQANKRRAKRNYQ